MIGVDAGNFSGPYLGVKGVIGADGQASMVLVIKRPYIGDGKNTVLCVYVGI